MVGTMMTLGPFSPMIGTVVVFLSIVFVIDYKKIEFSAFRWPQIN